MAQLYSKSQYPLLQNLREKAKKQKGKETKAIRKNLEQLAVSAVGVQILPETKEFLTHQMRNRVLSEEDCRDIYELRLAGWSRKAVASALELPIERVTERWNDTYQAKNNQEKQ